MVFTKEKLVCANTFIHFEPYIFEITEGMDRGLCDNISYLVLKIVTMGDGGQCH